MNGIINFFKPKGMTSHGAVNLMRRKFNIKRVGHTGTLDPEVSGVLPLCIGKATRVSEYLLESDKEYIGEITLGVETDSQDYEGRAIKTSDKKVSEEEIRQVFSKYLGEITQIPPMYSAIRHQGRHLYELAREGQTVERKPRKVVIYENEILKIDGNKVLFRVKCSKGTYIRTLCSDIGRELGTYGYMSHLIRTGVDIFTIEDAIGKETFQNMEVEDLEKIIMPMDKAIEYFPKIVLDKKYYEYLKHGRMIEIKDIYEVGPLYRIYSDNIFIGLGEIIEKENRFFIKMKKVLIA